MRRPTRTTRPWINYNDLNDVLPETGADAFTIHVWRSAIRLTRANMLTFMTTNTPVANLTAITSQYDYKSLLHERGGALRSHLPPPRSGVQRLGLRGLPPTDEQCDVSPRAREERPSRVRVHGLSGLRSGHGERNGYDDDQLGGITSRPMSDTASTDQRPRSRTSMRTVSNTSEP